MLTYVLINGTFWDPVAKAPPKTRWSSFLFSDGRKKRKEPKEKTDLVIGSRIPIRFVVESSCFCFLSVSWLVPGAVLPVEPLHFVVPVVFVDHRAFCF